MKTTITLPDEIFSAAESLAGRLGISPNELFRMALTEFVARHSDEEITNWLDRIYGRENDGLDPILQRAQRLTLGKAVEEFALVRAVQEGEASGSVSRDEVFQELERRREHGEVAQNGIDGD